MNTWPAISELVPHEPPMLLLDRILFCEDRAIRCALSVRDVPFARGGRVRSVVALEYMAQAAAAWTGWTARQRGEAPRPGYLVHVREVDLAVPAFDVGTQLEVEAEHVGGDSDLGSFEATVRAPGGGELLVRAVFSVYRGSP